MRVQGARVTGLSFPVITVACSPPGVAGAVGTGVKRCTAADTGSVAVSNAVQVDAVLTPAGPVGMPKIASGLVRATARDACATISACHCTVGTRTTAGTTAIAGTGTGTATSIINGATGGGTTAIVMSTFAGDTRLRTGGATPCIAAPVIGGVVVTAGTDILVVRAAPTLLLGGAARERVRGVLTLVETGGSTAGRVATGLVPVVSLQRGCTGFLLLALGQFAPIFVDDSPRAGLIMLGVPRCRHGFAGPHHPPTTSI